MVTASSTNLFVPFWQASQLLSGNFIKINLSNANFNLVKYGNLTKAVYILSRYNPVERNYLSSSKVEVSKFTSLSWHSKRESEIIKNDRMSNQRSFYRKRQLYIDSICTTFKNNLFINSC